VHERRADSYPERRGRLAQLRQRRRGPDSKSGARHLLSASVRALPLIAFPSSHSSPSMIHGRGTCIRQWVGCRRGVRRGGRGRSVASGCGEREKGAHRLLHSLPSTQTSRDGRRRIGHRGYRSGAGCRRGRGCRAQQMWAKGRGAIRGWRTMSVRAGKYQRRSKPVLPRRAIVRHQR
jgi:hypothetical protein